MSVGWTVVGTVFVSLSTFVFFVFRLFVKQQLFSCKLHVFVSHWQMTFQTRQHLQLRFLTAMWQYFITFQAHCLSLIAVQFSEIISQWILWSWHIRIYSTNGSKLTTETQRNYVRCKTVCIYTKDSEIHKQQHPSHMPDSILGSLVHPVVLWLSALSFPTPCAALHDTWKLGTASPSIGVVGVIINLGITRHKSDYMVLESFQRIDIFSKVGPNYCNIKFIHYRGSQIFKRTLDKTHELICFCAAQSNLFAKVTVFIKPDSEVPSGLVQTE